MHDPQAKAIAEFVQQMPATRFLGLTIRELGGGTSLMELAVREELTFDGTTVQGGLVAVLADYAAVSAAGSALPRGWRMATLGCETHNLRPATGDRLVARGAVVESASFRHLVARADVWIDQEGGPICMTGLFTAAGIPPR